MHARPIFVLTVLVAVIMLCAGASETRAQYQTGLDDPPPGGGPQYFTGGSISLPFGPQVAASTVVQAARQLSAVQLALAHWEALGYTRRTDLDEGKSEIQGAQAMLVLDAPPGPIRRQAIVQVISFVAGSDVATQVFGGALEDSSGYVKFHGENSIRVSMLEAGESSTTFEFESVIPTWSEGGATQSGPAVWASGRNNYSGTAQAFYYAPAAFVVAGGTTFVPGQSNCFFMNWGLGIGSSAGAAAASAALLPAGSAAASLHGAVWGAAYFLGTHASAQLSNPRCR